jgi:opacity protein-like surface antigen
MSTRTRYAAVSLGALRRIAAIALVAAALPSIVSAQVAAGRGFLLGVPDGTITVRGGWALASAGSDIFSFTTDQLTINRRDFSSPLVGADLALRVSSRTDLVISATYSGMHKRTEVRGFIDNNDKPINQTTGFVRVPITASVKQYLTSRGRSIGQLAWIPSRFSAYVGAGVGATWYRFRQDGDWIDFRTMDVFSAMMQSDGWTPAAHVLAGTEWSLGARTALVTEARYEYSHARLNASDFSGFGPIDLSGFSTTAGIAIRY